MIYSREIMVGWTGDYFCEQPVLGLDLGSRASKGVLLNDAEIYVVHIATGLYVQETADELIEKLLALAGLKRSEIGFITCTGYGRIALSIKDIPSKIVTEISCHAMGAHVLCPHARTIIDIGGQDSKAIKIDRANGTVVDFVMNDKCAAGTGQFLEKAAMLLGITLDQMGALALTSNNPTTISSQCVVFAESEMISLRSRGARSNDSEAVANIAAGIHYSAARRVKNLLGRIGSEPDLIFTGGVSKNPGMRKALEELIGKSFVPTKFDMIYTGALGAAIFAAQDAISEEIITIARSEEPAACLDRLNVLIEQEAAAFIDGSDGRKRVGHFCAYTPIEVLGASRVRHVRLFKAGDAKTVAEGELFTQSVFCDFTKSCIGGFVKGDPLYAAIDKLYNFHTCASIKRSTELIEQFVPIKLLNLPKMRNREASRRFFRDEIIEFKRDLAMLSACEITDEQISEQIVQYNAVRKLIKNISELRKRKNPPISGRAFLELVKAYYYVPPQKLISLYEEIFQVLSALHNTAPSPVRLMICGSIAADGDHRLLDLLEGEIGARVVVEDHCTGLKPFYNTIDETGDPYMAMANGYMDQSCCFHMRTLEDNVGFAGQLAQEYKVDGVIYVYLKFCSCYGITKKPFLDHFKTLDIPVLDLSSDYSCSDYGQTKTRIEAFMELIKARRSEKNGCAWAG